MKKRKGEIVTLLTVGAFVLVSVVAVASSFFLNQKKTTSARAAVTCDDPNWKCGPECANEKVRKAFGGDSAKWRAEAALAYKGCDNENQPIPPTPSCPGKYDITGGCNTACCENESHCQGQKCNVPNGYCQSGFSCNSNSEGKFHKTCVGNQCVNQPCPEGGTCTDDCTACGVNLPPNSGTTNPNPGGGNTNPNPGGSANPPLTTNECVSKYDSSIGSYSCSSTGTTGHCGTDGTGTCKDSGSGCKCQAAQSSCSGKTPTKFSCADYNRYCQADTVSNTKEYYVVNGVGSYADVTCSKSLTLSSYCCDSKTAAPPVNPVVPKAPTNCDFGGGVVLDFGAVKCTNDIVYTCSATGEKSSTACAPGVCEAGATPAKCADLSNLGKTACKDTTGQRIVCSTTPGEIEKPFNCTDFAGWPGSAKYSVVCSQYAPWACIYVPWVYSQAGDKRIWSQIGGYRDENAAKTDAADSCERNKDVSTTFPVSLTINNHASFLKYSGKFTEGKICLTNTDPSTDVCNTIPASDLNSDMSQYNTTFKFTPSNSYQWAVGYVFDEKGHLYQSSLTININEYRQPQKNGYGLTIDAENPAK